MDCSVSGLPSGLVCAGTPCDGCPPVYCGIRTAVGCVPVGAENINAFMLEFGNFFINIALGIGGGIAFLLLIYAGFQIMTSAGDPARLNSGKQLMTAAISGLLLIIFSVFLLRVLGVDILRIPGL